MNQDQPRLAAARRGFSLSYRGKSLLSSIDPIAQAERVVQSAKLLPKTLYLCPSPLLAYGLETLLGLIAPDSFILCVEQDEALMALSLEAIPQALLESARVHLIRSGSPSAVCAYVREKIGTRQFRRIERLNLNGGWLLAQALYSEIEEALRSDMAVNWSNAMTLVRLGRCYARNAVRNLGLIPKALSLAELNFDHEPILVAGAGPSLDSVLDDLETFLRKQGSETRKCPFRIVAVDTALGALIARGIPVDLAVALEAQHWNLRDFIGARTLPIPIAMDLSALPATASASAGPLTLFTSRWAPLAIFDRMAAQGLLPAEIPPLGSVGLSATALALRLTTGPVFVSGLDFSYELDAYHAKATPSRVDQLRRSSRLQSLIRPEAAFRDGVTSVPGKNGTSPRTDPALRSYRDLFEREFGSARRDSAAQRRLYDLGGRGLPLGIPAIGMEEALFLAMKDGRTSGESVTTGPQWGTEVSGDPARTAASREAPRERILSLIDSELADLRLMREALRGEREIDIHTMEAIVDRADYLWAHFPECAGADGDRPSIENASFLKRLRVELDPFIAAFELARRNILELPDPAPRPSRT